MKISMGNHSKIQVNKVLKEKVREFYVSVMGCTSTPSPSIDAELFEFEGGFVVGVFFSDEENILSEEDHLKGTWLEIKTEKPEQLKKRLLDFGVKEVSYLDKSLFYFQAPGGQVFRLAP